VFGIAEGYDAPGVWYAFDNEHINEETFHQHIYDGRVYSQTYWTTWRLSLALMGQGDDPRVAAELLAWREGWILQLPIQALS